MKTKNRPTFKCWNCSRTYSLFREITDEQTLKVACPYCNAEAVVDLKPYRKKKPIPLVRGENDGAAFVEELKLPDILPTQKPE